MNEQEKRELMKRFNFKDGGSGTFYMAYKGDNIDNDHYHFGSDDTLLSIKTSNVHKYNRAQIRTEIKNATSLSLKILWQSNDQRQHQDHQEREQKQHEWTQRTRENIRKLEVAIANIMSSILRDKKFLSSQERKLYSVKPGRKDYKIKDVIRKKIQETENKIMEKQKKMREMQDSLSEMKRKLNA